MPREPTGKRACPGGRDAAAVAADRLSDLPDGLLHIVMSFLPAPQVVRTSVLSRRWRDLWQSTPCINIDEREFVSNPRDSLCVRKENLRRFEDFTTNLLLFHNNVASVDKFQIFADNTRPRDLTRWLRRGVKYCPQVLEIRTIGRFGLYFPFPHMGGSSYRLKRLHLYGLCLDNRFAEVLCSGCPVLEDLELSYCKKGFAEVASYTLKKLVINSSSHLTDDLLVIKAPSLAYLQLGVSYGYYSNGISVHATPSLMEAAVYLSILGVNLSLENQRRLLHDLSNVPNLDLSGFGTMAMVIDKPDGHPVLFPNMRTLLFKYCFLDKCDLDDKLDALGNFVQNAPTLEKLTLKCCMFQVGRGAEQQLVRKTIILPRQDQNTFKCQNLKLIEVVYEEDHDHQLVELLCGIGRRLPNASIKLSNVSMG